MVKGWCNYPKRCVPSPGEVGAGFKATCPCGKRVSVTVRGLFWRHKAMHAMNAVPSTRTTK